MKIIYIGNSIIPDEFILFSLNFFISPNDRGILTKKKDEKKGEREQIENIQLHGFTSSKHVPVSHLTFIFLINKRFICYPFNFYACSYDQKPMN